MPSGYPLTTCGYDRKNIFNFEAGSRSINGITCIMHEHETERGGDMRSGSKASSAVLFVILAFVVSGCTTVLKVDYKPLPNPDNVLASVSPVRVKVLPFVDKREDRAESTLIGGVKRAAIAPVDDVLAERSVNDIIGDAVKAELTRNGHSVVESNEEVTVTGEIKTFWLYTDITSDAPNDWDVIGEVKILMQIKRPGTGDASFVGPYFGKKIERRFIQPDKSIYKMVVDAALSDMIKKMSSDTKLASELKK